MPQEISDNIAIVFNGFLALSMKEKARLVNVLNDFFDHPDKREELRRVNEVSGRSISQLPNGNADAAAASAIFKIFQIDSKKEPRDRLAVPR